MNRRGFGKSLGAMASLGTIDSSGWRQVAAQAQRPVTWPSKPPSDCPFVQSQSIKGIAFTGRNTRYAGCDSWFPSWASDDNLYSSYADGQVGGTVASSYAGPKASTGRAKILGSGPLNLEVSSIGVHVASAVPYRGRYPCANLVHNDIWYCGTYCLDRKNPHLNWDVLGPFVGFGVSTNYGLSWTDTKLTPTLPLFMENGKNDSKVKMGAPHFVDFGKNMQYSPDGKAYLLAHGAERTAAELTWVSGDQIYLARVIPSIKTINDLSKYEFYAGCSSDGKPQWTSDFAAIRPLLEWNYRTGPVTATYNPVLKKYFMFITDGYPTVFRMNTYILESDEVTGPWKLVTFMESFGEQAYNVNMPSKFIGEDGTTAWLVYSANYTNAFMHTAWKSIPDGGGYWLTLQEIKLLAT
jgi:hypothetical protein